MTPLDVDIKNLSRTDIAKTIRMLDEQEDTPEVVAQIIAATGYYLLKLQDEFNYSPVFPTEQLPIPKDRMKYWGRKYAELAVSTTGQLQRFQQDGSLLFTQFQHIRPDLWQAIKSDSIDGLTQYNAEMRDHGKSDVIIPPAVQSIIVSYRKEYNKEEADLHEYLKSVPRNLLGCKIRAMVIVAIVIGGIWYFIH